MPSFNYEIVDEKNEKIVNLKGLPLLIVGIARTRVSQRAAVLGEDENTHDYAGMTRKFTKAMAAGNDTIKKRSDITKPVVDNLLKLIDESETYAKKHGAPHSQISGTTGIELFFKEIVKGLVDSVDVVKNQYAPTKDDPDTMAFDPQVKFTHDGNVWAYKNKEIDVENNEQTYTLTVNDIDIGDLKQSEKINDEAKWVALLLAFVAKDLIREVMAEHKTEQLKGNPSIVKKAKAISDIVGGDYSAYLLEVAFIEFTINEAVAEGKAINAEDIDPDLIISLFQKANKLDAADTQAVINILLEKPVYH
jgi:hypothetical protein